MTGIRTTVDAKGLALVVDDEPHNRKFLELLLEQEGYRTLSAEDGAQAVKLYAEQNPDIVFMDAIMPVMDGYEATARIKALAGMCFVPVIFVTALSEAEEMVRCIEAGGDDILCKPFKPEILGAKIKAMERIRGLSIAVAELHQKFESHNQLLVNEQIIAEQIYHRAIVGENVETELIRSMLRPVAVFSGDMLITSYHPDGSLYVLLGDFTGHGLIAAVGMLPAAEVFRAMTAKGFAVPEIMTAINSKLHRLLPTGMFMTACIVTIDKSLKSASIWNAGMPDVLVLANQGKDTQGARVKHRVVSRYLALGILKDADLEPAPMSLKLDAGDRILLCSDGVTEAINAAGMEFGVSRYEQAAMESLNSFNAVVTALQDFCGKQPFTDDVSLVEIDCVPGLLKQS